MLDENLISLLRSTDPESLTESEIAQIRERLTESNEFRAAIRELIPNEQVAEWVNRLVEIPGSESRQDFRQAAPAETSDELHPEESSLPSERHTAASETLDEFRYGRLFGLVGLLALVTIGALWWNANWRQHGDAEDGAAESAKSVETTEPRDEVVTSKSANNSKTLDHPIPPESKTEPAPGQIADATDAKPDDTTPNDGSAVKPEIPSRPTLPIKPPAPDFGELPGLVETPRPLDKLFVIDRSTRRPGKFDDPSGKNIGGFTGTIRLKPEWEQDTLWRCQFDRSSDRFEMSFWRRTDGVLIRFYRHRGLSWGAYRVERTGKAPEPVSFVLVDTDSGVYRRVGAEQLEIRHQDDHLVIASAGRVMMDVPFAGLPEQFYLSGRARFRGYQLVRSGPIPNPSPAPLPLVREIDRPADEPWVKQLPQGVDLDTNDDGSVRLKAGGPAKKGWVALPFDRVGFHEVIYQIQSPTPGSGIFLGTNEPTQPFGFFSETVRRTTVLEFALGRSWETTMRVQERVVPYVDDLVWVKLLYGVESIGVSMSYDGKRWFAACEPIPRRYGTVTHFGIYCDQGHKPRGLTLKRIEVRELSTIREMADAKLLARTPSFATADYPHQWFEIAADALPENASVIEWRRACCVKSLSQTRAVSLASPVWRDLFRDGLFRQDWAHEKKQAFVAEMLRVIPSINRGYPPFPFESFDRLEQQRIQAGQPSLIDAYLEAARTGPSVSRERIDFIPIQSIRQQLLKDYHAGNSPAVHQRSLDFRLTTRTLDWRDPHRELDGLIEWLRRSGTSQPPVTWMPDSPHNHSVSLASHPLQNMVKKETHNLFAELQANLATLEFEEACKIALQVDGESEGVLPVPNSPHLFVSLPMAIEAAMQDHPLFRQTMTDKFASRVKLRVNEAIAQNDWSALKQISRQFPRTAAAAAADAYLGHWHLNSGRFAAASSCYRRAMVTSGVDQAALRARYYLAEAMQGRLVEDAEIPDTVAFGERTMSADEYARLLDEMRASRQPILANRRQEALPLSQPSDLTIQQWGDQPFAADAKGNRLVSGQVLDDHMYLSNGVELACYRLADGKRKWRQRFGGSTNTPDQPQALLRPLAVDGQLIARIETKQKDDARRLGPRLARIDIETGEMIGTPTQPAVLSNLLVRERELWAVTADLSQATLEFHLSVFDSQTLETVKQHPLLTTQSFFDHQRYPTFRLASTDDELIVTGAGCTVCTDTDGFVRWVRRHPWYPPIDIDRTWAQHGTVIL